MTQVAAAIEQANPEWNSGSLVGVRPLGDHLVGASTRSWMLMLLAAVAIVLLIACAPTLRTSFSRAQRHASARSPFVRRSGPADGGSCGSSWWKVSCWPLPERRSVFCSPGGPSRSCATRCPKRCLERP